MTSCFGSRARRYDLLLRQQDAPRDLLRSGQRSLASRAGGHTPGIAASGWIGRPPRLVRPRRPHRTSVAPAALPLFVQLSTLKVDERRARCCGNAIVSSTTRYSVRPLVRRLPRRLTPVQPAASQPCASCGTEIATQSTSSDRFGFEPGPERIGMVPLLCPTPPR